MDLSGREVALVTRSEQTGEVVIMQLEGGQMSLVIDAPMDVEELYTWGSDRPVRTVPVGPGTVEMRIKGVVRYTINTA